MINDQQNSSIRRVRYTTCEFYEYEYVVDDQHGGYLTVETATTAEPGTAVLQLVHKRSKDRCVACCEAGRARVRCERAAQLQEGLLLLLCSALLRRACPLSSCCCYFSCLIGLISGDDMLWQDGFMRPNDSEARLSSNSYEYRLPQS